MGPKNIGKKSAILTVCDAGLDRSVALKAELFVRRGYKNIMNMGVSSVDKTTERMMYDWADLIIVFADTGVWDTLPWDAKGHAVFIDIGKDVWDDPRHPELVKLAKKAADKLGL